MPQVSDDIRQLPAGLPVPVDDDGVVEHVIYPVFPRNHSAEGAARWLEEVTSSN